MSFAEALEVKCRKLINRIGQQSGQGPAASIWREIALVLDHLESVRAGITPLQRELDRLEGHIENRLLNLEHSRNESVEMRFHTDRLRSDLVHSRIRLERQRHQLTQDYQHQQQTLRDRLLVLWDRSCQCGVDYEPKRPSRKTRTGAA